MTTLAQDIRYGIRMLAKNPGFTALAALSLALGIGVNTSIFSFVNAVLLRPLPVNEPDRLVTMFSDFENDERYTSTSYPDFRDYRERNAVFEDIAVSSLTPLGLKGSGRAEAVLGQLVSGNYFDVTGIRPVMGRSFLPEESVTEGTHPVAVISDPCWRDRFGADPEIVGKEVLLSGYPFTIIGVMPRGHSSLQVGLAPEVWVTLMMQSKVAPVPANLESRGSHYLNEMIGRLKPGVTIAQAQSHMDALAAQLGEEYPDTNEGKGIALVSANRNRTFLQMIDDGAVKLFMAVLMAVVGAVLLIACFNVANLLLARAAKRQREVAVRVSLGAGRWRIARQLLTEGLLLSLTAGALGVFLAIWMLAGLEMLVPTMPVPITFDFPIDQRVLLFTLAVSLGAGLFFGMAPAWQTFRLQVFDALRDKNAAEGGARKARMQHGLVVAQVALSLFLLITAGLCLQSLRYAGRMDVGFNPDNSVALGINLVFGGYDEQSGQVFLDRLVERVEAVPGVAAVGFGSGLPMGLRSNSSTVSIPGYEPARDERMSLYNTQVSDGYFKAMGIPILEGRPFDRRDAGEDALPVIIVNEAFAKRFWPDDTAVGKTVGAFGDDRTVVGVAKTGKYRTLHEPPEAVYYIPASQEWAPWVDLVIRSQGDPSLALAAALRELQSLDANLPAFDIKTLHEHLGFAQTPSRLLGSLVGSFGLLALLLAMIGVYGVIAYSVSQRTHEFGIRAALGGRRVDILALVLRQGLMLTLIGLALGLGAAFASTRMLSSFLLGVDALDPVTFVGVSLGLLVVALLACYLPARRAARVAPMTALRYE